MSAVSVLIPPLCVAMLMLGQWLALFGSAFTLLLIWPVLDCCDSVCQCCICLRTL